MSLSLMACHPRMEEPSKPRPSSKVSSEISLIGNEQCCQVPGQSMNRRSTMTALDSAPSASASLGVMLFLCLWG